ncbi:hypothetical protein CA830_25095, partial [Burkholderia multivorans]
MGSTASAAAISARASRAFIGCCSTPIHRRRRRPPDATVRSRPAARARRIRARARTAARRRARGAVAVGAAC